VERRPWRQPAGWISSSATVQAFLKQVRQLAAID
jgi:hypothetical protein